jgi:predicted PurR-regulated permease PerM
MEERIRTLGRAAWWLVGITLVALIIGFLGWTIRVVFPPLVLAGIIVFLANPVVSRLHRRGLPRVLGTAVTYLGFVLALGLIGLALSPLLGNQFDQLSERVPKIRDDLEKQINKYSKRSEDENWFIKIPNVKEIQNQAGGGDGQDLSKQVTTVRHYVTRGFHIALILILGPVIAFYMLMDLPDIRRRCEELIPEPSKPRVLFLAHRLNLIIGGFFRGQLAVAFIVGCMVSAGLFAIRLPLWLVVGMIAGLFNIVPLIGPYVGAIPGIVVALATKDVKAAIGVAIVMVVAQQIDNHFITPFVMRRAVHLHPAAVVLALLVFGTLGGFFGLLLAVPLTASLKVLGGHVWRRYVMGVSVPGLDEPDPAAGPDPPDGISGIVVMP